MFERRWWGKHSNWHKKKSQGQGQSSKCEERQTLNIKQLADTYRALLLSEMLPVQFVRECVKFDQEIVPDGSCDEQGDLGEGDDLMCRAIGVLKRLAAAKAKVGNDEQEPETRTNARCQHQLALIWLDGHSFGQIELSKLEGTLERLRQTPVLSQADAEAAGFGRINVSGIEVQLPSDGEGEREWENW